MDGDHSIEDSAKATGRALQALYTELHDQRVDLRGTLLKPNMVLSGYEAADRAGVDEVAERTLEVLYRHVPAAVPGIVFLSGGQSRRGRDRAPERDERARAASVAALVLLRPGAAGARAARPGPGDAGERRGGAAGVLHRAQMNGAARTGVYTRRARGSLSALPPAHPFDVDGARRRLVAKAAATRSSIPRRASSSACTCSSRPSPTASAARRRRGLRGARRNRRARRRGGARGSCARATRCSCRRARSTASAPTSSSRCS